MPSGRVTYAVKMYRTPFFRAAMSMPPPSRIFFGQGPKLLKKAFPHENINVSDEIEKRFVFGLNAIPEYLGGVEVADIIDDIIDSIPQNLSESARIRLCKEKLRDRFHIESNKYPRWIQETEWPMGEDGIPMKFISKKRKKGKAYDTMLFTEFLFEDVKTGKQCIVEQFT